MDDAATGMFPFGDGAWGALRTKIFKANIFMIRKALPKSKRLSYENLEPYGI